MLIENKQWKHPVLEKHREDFFVVVKNKVLGLKYLCAWIFANETI